MFNGRITHHAVENVNPLFALEGNFFFGYGGGMKIGTIVAVARRRAEIPQKDVARMLGISQQYLTDMEQGRRTFHERFVQLLPDVMQDEVRAAFVAKYEAAIERLRGAAQ